MGATYDSSKHSNRRVIVHAPTLAGLSVPGTAASDTVLLRIPVCENITVSGTARIRLATGGTAAGPTITFAKSLAGTGAAAAFGTYASGTAADGTPASAALTSTDFDPGDEILVVNGAGTAAATPKIVFSLSYAETLE